MIVTLFEVKDRTGTSLECVSPDSRQTTFVTDESEEVDVSAAVREVHGKKAVPHPDMDSVESEAT